MIKNKQTKTSTPDDGQEEAKEDDQLEEKVKREEGVVSIAYYTLLVL